MVIYIKIGMVNSCPYALQLMIEIMSRRFWITYMKVYILKNITESHMLIEFKRFRLYSLLKRKMYKHNIMKIIIAMKQ